MYLSCGEVVYHLNYVTAAFQCLNYYYVFYLLSYLSVFNLQSIPILTSDRFCYLVHERQPSSSSANITQQSPLTNFEVTLGLSLNITGKEAAKNG